MQIHELNNYDGNLDAGAYLAVDNGNDTGKISAEDLTGELRNRIGETEANYLVLEERMDGFSSLPPGSTAGNAELVDIRVGELGGTFPNAGDAVRDQISYIAEKTENLFDFKGGTYNGVTVKRQPDGGLYISGTCTGSINVKQNIVPIVGPYSLVCDCEDSISSGELYVVLRNSAGAQIYQMAMSGNHAEGNSTASESNPIAQIDLTFINGKTYNYTIYVQLLKSSLYKAFVSPYTAVDRVARNFIDDGTDYVTPQMFGAVADGITNDYNAIMAALNSGKNVFLPPGTYYIDRTIYVPDSFYRHKIYADADRERFTATIKCGALPAIATLGAGWKIEGIAFTEDAFPDLSGLNPENRPYISLYAANNADDLDITIEHCYFEKNYCMIFAQGRNVNIIGNLFYDMNNTGYCIYLNYPETADGEHDTNVNGFKNNSSGFRGIQIIGNRCHYTRNWLLNTRATRCQKMKGLVIRDNYLEGAFCVTGFLNNAVVENNITFQVNHYDWDNNRRDACFNLIEMVNTIIDGYSCTGSDKYVNIDGVTIDEAMLGAFLLVNGQCINCRVTNIFVSNYLYNAFAFVQGATSLRLDATIRKTRTTNNPVSIGSGSYHNIIDVTINDITDSPQEGQYIVDWYPRENAEDNYIRVTSNYDCIKYPE